MLYFNNAVTVTIHLINVKILLVLSVSSILFYLYIFNFQLNICETPLRHTIREEKLPSDLKYILLWSQKDFFPFTKFGYRREPFIKNNCSVINCYVTTNRKLFGDSLFSFEAIIFNGRDLDKSDLPVKRYNHQKYIYVNFESAANYPVCYKVFDDFFNLTFTYRLDSEIVFQYFQIRDMNNYIVGPNTTMNWSYNLKKTNDKVVSKWKNKTKAVAWIVSNCETSNKREDLANKIGKQLKSANLSLDIFGQCGDKTCDINDKDSCWVIIENEYYFYLAFENSHAEDYVTEKLLNPLQHYTIPIVFGGANYSRYLPPGSYIDASKWPVKKLVAKIIKIMRSKNLYKRYFGWHNVYKYSNAERDNVCALCSAANNEDVMKTNRTYTSFRRWWFPAYRNACNSTLARLLRYLFGHRMKKYQPRSQQ